MTLILAALAMATTGSVTPEPSRFWQMNSLARKRLGIACGMGITIAACSLIFLHVRRANEDAQSRQFPRFCLPLCNL